MSNRIVCNGWVWTLRKRTVVFTGTMLKDGHRYGKTRCWVDARAVGAVPERAFTRRTDLVVVGKLHSNVKDPKRRHSNAIISAWEARHSTRHVHVVDAEGFYRLAEHHRAQCLDIVRRGGRASVVKRKQALGGPLKVPHVPPKAPTTRRTPRLVDMSALDASTVEHNRTLKRLDMFLKSRGVKPQTHEPGGPRFDAGWKCDGVQYIAEVKSLRGTRQDQQIRLGVGQVLDYVEQLRGTGRLRAVLVLERKPTQVDRWLRLCKAHTIVLSWPTFTALLAHV